MIKNLNPGLIKNVNEKFTMSFSPDFVKWLDPKITYNPSYSWDLATQNDSLSLSNINVYNVKNNPKYNTKGNCRIILYTG